MDVSRFRTHTVQDERVLRILAAALDSVEPGRIVREYLSKATLPPHDRVFLLGIGKAAEPMTYAALESLQRRSPKQSPARQAPSEPVMIGGLITTKQASENIHEGFDLIEAGHPIPNRESVRAGHASLDFVSQLNENDLLICLISGGGSALMTLPQENISLQEIQDLTNTLLASGANIHEINLLRRQLDRVKGGGLARATKGQVLSLILSDVLGNPLEIIASGPTVQSKISSEETLRVLKKHIPHPKQNILDALAAAHAPFDETMEQRVQNHVIADIETAAKAAQSQAVQEGFKAELSDLSLQGEAGEVGLMLANKLKEERKKRDMPFCLIAGGETTVTVRGNGKGGRNQELALATVNELRDVQNIMFIALATDGDDGPTDAAGAVVNGTTYQRAERLGMSAADYLSRNDAYHYFESLGDLLKTGYTGTNVNDLVFLIGL